MSFDLPSDYNDVNARIVEFRTKYPDGSLQQAALEFRQFADTSWVIYTAAAYRTPDDQRPGHGTAWERVPGKTPYTRDSELQNAETAAWGRAIVAALAADTKKGIASAEEVRNRRAPRVVDVPLPQTRVQQAVAEHIAAGPEQTDAGDIYGPDEDPSDALLAQRFEELIDGASTKDELDAIGKDIAAASLQGTLRDSLRQAFSYKQTELAGKP